VTATAIAVLTGRHEHPAPHPHDGVLVLHERPLRPAVSLEDTDRFEDDVWALTPAILQDHVHSLHLDFTTLPADRRTVTKELCYALLSGPLPAGEVQRLNPVTIREVFTECKRFFTWLDRRTPDGSAPALSALTAADLLNYQRHLVSTLPGGNSRSRARAGVRRLWRYRDNLITDRLAFDPRHIDGWGEPNPVRGAENATDRIPEQVFGPLLAWALRFIDDFAPDILVADQRWRELRTRASTVPLAEVPAAVQALIDQHLQQRRPLPGHRGRANLTSIAGLLGIRRHLLPRYRPQIDAVAAVVGVAPNGLLGTLITGQLDGKPWIDGIATMHKGVSHGLGTLARLLQAACYIVIAYLSGMRDSQ
jgi:hypothetical protein